MRRSRKFPELPRSVTEARATGSRRYFTGNPCPQGHVEPKSTCNQRCIECDRLRWHERKAKAARGTPPPPPTLATPLYIAAHLTRGWRACIAGRMLVADK